MDAATIAGIVYSTIIVVGVSFVMLRLAISIHQNIKEHDV